MDATKDELAKAFDEKVSELVSQLEAWFEQETDSIDGADAPSGEGGSIIGMRPAIEFEAGRRCDGRHQEGARHRTAAGHHQAGRLHELRGNDRRHRAEAQRRCLWARSR